MRARRSRRHVHCHRVGVSRRTLTTLFMGGVAVAYVSAQPPSAPTVADRGRGIVPAERHDVAGPLRSVPLALVAAAHSGWHRQIKDPGPLRVGHGPRGRRLHTPVPDATATPW